MDVRRKMLMKKTSSGNSGGGSTTSGSYTVVLNNQWRLSTSISNPDLSIYEGVYESNSNYNVNSTAAVMYIDINGLSEFKLYIRSYAESNYDYVMVSQLDKTITNDSSYSDTTLVKAHTRGTQQSGTSISNYTLVEFTGIDKGSHRITIVYRKDGSQHSNQDRGYVLIPKGQGSSDSGGDIIVDPNNYMAIYALEDGLQAKLSGNTVSYSIDEGATWTSLSSDTYTPTVNSGQTIMFKGNLTPNRSNGIGRFTINKQCNLIGNCMSLLFGDNAASNNSLSGKDSAFSGLFRGCTTIVDVSESFLPATTLANSCYFGMFYDCTSLTTAPELPATTLTGQCYQDMFYRCSSLTTAPELPATKLAGSCYQTMFAYCTSLTDAPELPATTLASDCYSYMFNNTNVLPDCSNIDFSSSAIVSSGGLRGLFAYTKVTDADLFNILPINPSTGKYWLPATTLNDYCYDYMFSGCSSLVTAPELPATILNEGCYYGMFYGCSKLNYIKMLATDISVFSCLDNWVVSVASTGTFVKNKNATWNKTGTSGIPSGWTVYNNGEEPEQESPQVAGDVAYYTNGQIKTISASKWNTSLGTPIGVVVIPSNFLPDGKARILSLNAVDSSGNATTLHGEMYWEQSGNYVDTTLTNYNRVPITNNTSSTSSSYNNRGKLPSDNFWGHTSFVDGSVRYYNTDTDKIPSPYNGSEFNTDYSKEISGYNNALSDFNGLSNTQVLVGLGNDYEAANAAWKYNDGVSNTQWYLPSMGELGFMLVRFKTINTTISKLGGVVVPSDYFWSSTEYSNSGTYYMCISTGNIDDSFKVNCFCVRPFALLDNNGGGTSLITLTEGDNGEYGVLIFNYLKDKYMPISNGIPVNMEPDDYIIIENGSLENKIGDTLNNINFPNNTTAFLRYCESQDLYILFSNGKIEAFDD